MTIKTPPIETAEYRSFMLACLSCALLWVYSLYQLVQYGVWMLKERLRASTLGTWFGWSMSPTVAAIRAETKQFRKLPQHVALVIPTSCAQLLCGNGLGRLRVYGVSLCLSEEEMALRRLAEWICWCLAAGVHQVSLYDEDGLLQSRVERLQKATLRAERRLFGKKRHTIRWSVLDEETLERLADGGYINSPGDSGIGDADSTSGMEDMVNQPDLRVFIVSRAFGKEYMVQVTRALFKEHILKPDLDTIHSRLLVSHFTEPQLLITCDGLRAYAPWHLRLTEFYQIPMYGCGYDVAPSLDHLMEGLRRYAGCNQRFGK